MKVLLLSPPSRIMNHYRPPLALMYLSGYLKHNKIETKIIDIPIKKQIRDKRFYDQKDIYLQKVETETIKIVKDIESDIVGITCYTPEIEEVNRIVSKIKNIKPQVKIVVGGIHPTLYPNDFLGSASNFDFVVIGEGEITFHELIKEIRSKKPNYNNIKGIGYFDRKTSKNIITEKQPLVENLDEIAFPDYEDLDMNFYTTTSPYAIRGVFTKCFYISSSRGCPSSCLFCVSKKMRAYHGIKKFVRLRSAKSLYDEITYLQTNYKIDSFYFIDDLFTLKKQNVSKFCDLLIKNNSHLIWGCSSKVNTVNEEILTKMRDAGCVQIDFGVERGSDKSLKLLKKGISIKQIKNTFKLCQKLGIRTFANMLVNVPEETEKDLDDIEKLVQCIKPNIVSFNIFTPYPGCELFDKLCNNITKKDYPLLMEPPTYLTSEIPEKFRFALHCINFEKWANAMAKKYNKVLPNIYIYFTIRYLINILSSKRKIDYLKQVSSLVREFITQKF